jgi:hypothetical protein
MLIISTKSMSSILKLIDCDISDKFLQIRTIEDSVEFATMFSKIIYIECTIPLKDLANAEQGPENFSVILDNNVMSKLHLMCKWYPGHNILFEENIVTVMDLVGSNFSVNIEDNNEYIYKPILFNESFTIETRELRKAFELTSNNDEPLDIDINEDKLQLRNSNCEYRFSVTNFKKDSLRIELSQEIVHYIIKILALARSKECKVYMSKTGPFVIETEQTRIFAVHG